ncbi:MAG: type IX secretion system sortase PorU [Ignavibacteriaceae bacterium]
MNLKNSKIILILLVVLTLKVYPQKSFEVISSNNRYLVLSYSPVFTDTSVVSYGNQDFINVDFYNSYLPEISVPGMPRLTEYRINIGVPGETGNTIQILSTEYEEINGRILPVERHIREGDFDKLLFEPTADYFSYEPADDPVVFGEFGISRGIPVQIIRIRPVEFFPTQNKIKLYTKIVFRINFYGGSEYSSVPADDFLKDAIVNFDVARFWNKKNLSLKKEIINSVLAEGKWYRFEAPEEGIYRITYQDLPSYGIDPNTVDPRTIKIYNNGGKILPENINTYRPPDLQEIAIKIIGEEDGKFDPSDYILFYGRGVHFRDFDSSSQKIIRFFNPYSNENYFWITSGGASGKRMQNKVGLNQPDHIVQTTTRAFADTETDLINIGNTGRQFFGDDFSSSLPSRSYIHTLNGRVQATDINYNIRFINATGNSITVNFYESGNLLESKSINGFGPLDYDVGVEGIIQETYNGSLTDNRSNIKLEMISSSGSSLGYLDYIEIEYTSDLKPVNNNKLFFSPETTAVVEYYLSGFSSSNIKVYDITDHSDVKPITNYVLISGGDCRFQAQESSDKISKYFAVGDDNFKIPVNPLEVSNSNIHGFSEGAKFIIITHKNFLPAANRLKNYRENEAVVKLSTHVVDIEHIFNEFGGGLKDVTAIRDFLKYAYDNWAVTPEYVLFFGKGTYDYKNIEGFNTNYIPTWQTVESLSLVFGKDSYTTDDYFTKVDGDDSRIDLASGRITVETSQQAEDIVDKIIRYENGTDLGTWRNLITLVADDGYKGNEYEGALHVVGSETLANTYIPQSFDINKIYLAEYPDVITSAGKRKPDVNKAIIDAVNRGTLIINYVGHGSPDLWAHEVVFDKSVTVPQMINERYCFLTAATCDFGYFDIPNFQSAAEMMLLKNNGGTIGVLSSARLVFSSLNHTLMYNFFKDLLDSPRDTLNLSVPIGKALFLTKQILTGVNDQKYFIFGDPTLRLHIPQYFARIDSINGNDLSTTVQINALGDVSIRGTVLDPAGSPWTDFSGEGVLTIFDSERKVKLERLNNYEITVQGGTIFRGRVSVNNGTFAENFVVPKDISYENKNGKAVLYFFNNNSDGIGFTTEFIVGGTDTSKQNDGEGPEIEIYFDDPSYSGGNLITPNSKLIIHLSDETGINTTGTGVGHKLEGILNGEENNPIDFTEYFTGDLDAGGRSGEINYPFSGLKSGNYELLVKAWDVFNNFSEKTTYFSVVSDDNLVLQDVYNYPNPFSSNTSFTFQQNLTMPLDVRIKIYSVSGRLIREIERRNLNEKFVKIDWDGRDQDGDLIANGTYLYKLIVKTVDGSYSETVLGKLAVIR